MIIAHVILVYQFHFCFQKSSFLLLEPREVNCALFLWLSSVWLCFYMHLFTFASFPVWPARRPLSPSYFRPPEDLMLGCSWRSRHHVHEEEEVSHPDLGSVQLRASGPHRLRWAGAEVRRAAEAMAVAHRGHGQEAQTFHRCHYYHYCGAAQGGFSRRRESYRCKQRPIEFIFMPQVTNLLISVIYSDSFSLFISTLRCLWLRYSLVQIQFYWSWYIFWSSIWFKIWCISSKSEAAFTSSFF